MWMRTLGVLVTSLAACDDDGAATRMDGGDAPIDAMVDVAIDMGIDAPPAPVGHYHYVIDHVNIPTNNLQAQMYGLDLNGDATIDNQLGMVFGSFASVMGMDVTTPMNRAVDRGESITLVDLTTTTFTTDPAATVALYAGEQPSPGPCTSASDSTCRHHLAGTASFTLATTPTNAALTGAFASSTLTAGPGQLALPLAWPGTGSFRVPLIGARVKITGATATSLGTMTIAGAISSADVNTTLIPNIRDGFAAQVAADCTALANPPVCGCAQGSKGKTALDLLDGAPKDCMISLAEVQQNSLFQSLLAPDLEIGGVDALSIGVTATAVHAAFADLP